MRVQYRRHIVHALGHLFDLFLWNQIAISIYSGSKGGHAITQGIAPRTFSIHGVTSLVLWARPTFLGARDPEISPGTCLKVLKKYIYSQIQIIETKHYM